MSDAPAATSLLIAAATLLQRDDVLVHWEKPLAHAVLEAAGADGRLLRALGRCAVGRGALRLLQRTLLPGLAAHYLWRKRRIARWVEEHVQRGRTQALLLGAGFDPLGAWLAIRHPQVSVIECDRAATLGIKARAMDRVGLGASNLRPCPVDLGAPAATVAAGILQACDLSRPTVIVAEGVLMYLEQGQVGALLRGLAAGLPAPTAVVATAMARDRHGRVGFERGSPLVRHWLRWRGEPFRWGAARSELAAVLASNGLQLLALAEPAGLDPDPCPGEWLFRARLAAD